MTRTPRLLALAAAAALASTALADNGRERFEARLKGYDEVPQTLSTTGSGRFKASYDRSSGAIAYELTFGALEGAVTMSHLHLGRRGLNGGIMVWLCQTSTNPDPAVAAGSPSCPLAGGTVSGVLQSSNVVGPAGQGVAAGEFAELIAAMRAGAVYVNVHSSRYPGGEIRGQVREDD